MPQRPRCLAHRRVKRVCKARRSLTAPPVQRNHGVCGSVSQVLTDAWDAVTCGRCLGQRKKSTKEDTKVGT